MSIAQLSGETQGLWIDNSAATSSSVYVQSGSLLASDTLIGTASGYNSTLTFGQDTAIGDGSFTNVMGISDIVLTGTSAVTLGAGVASSGGNSLLSAVWGGSGSSTIAQTADFINALQLDGSAGSNNYFAIDTAGVISNDTIIGGGGINTLSLATADTLTDDAFANVRAINVLTLADGSMAVLGTNAETTGISTVVGSTGGATIDASADGHNLRLDGSAATAANSLVAGSGNDTLVAGQAADTLTGGSGADEFVIGSRAGVALVNNFTGADFLDLPYAASEYSIIGATPQDGSYNQQLFHGSTLIADLNLVSGVDPTTILGSQTHLI